jgi:transmembrane sensor
MPTSEQQIRFAITQLAAEWYLVHRAGPLSETKRSEFLAWLKSSTVHIEEYLGIAALDRVLPQAADQPRRSLAELRELTRDPAGSVIDMVPASLAAESDASAMDGVRRPWFRAAALAIVGIGGIWALWSTVLEPRTPTPTTYATAHGLQGTWPLPDGSTLRLDTDSAVTVRYSPAGRLVELDRGQLWVAVAHDGHRPFHVRVGPAEIVAIGTEFDVYRMARATRVTVMNGQVAVSLNTAPHQMLRVGADQEVQIRDGVLPSAPAPAHPREATAWLEQKIVFERRPLGEIADEFNRYNAVPFTIDDPALRRVLISGTFAASDTDSFAAFLQTLTGVRVERLPAAFKISTTHT